MSLMKIMEILARINWDLERKDLGLRTLWVHPKS